MVFFFIKKILKNQSCCFVWGKTSVKKFNEAWKLVFQAPFWKRRIGIWSEQNHPILGTRQETKAKNVNR